MDFLEIDGKNPPELETNLISHIEIVDLLGLDLGKSVDFSALVLCRCFKYHKKILPDFLGRDLPDQLDFWEPMLVQIKYIHRWMLSTSYLEICNDVESLIKNLKVKTGKTPFLIMDGTGVGAPIIDIFREKNLQFLPIVISGGQNTHLYETHVTVPKENLLASVQILLNQQRLKIGNIRNKDLLFKELKSIQHKTTKIESNDHDDIALALSYCAWYGLKFVEKYVEYVSDPFEIF